MVEELTKGSKLSISSVMYDKKFSCTICSSVIFAERVKSLSRRSAISM